MSTADQKPWAGWFRPRGRLSWQKLVEADSQGDALGLLLDATDGSGDLVVLPRGERPDAQPSKVFRGQRHPPTMPGREDRR